MNADQRDERRFKERTGEGDDEVLHAEITREIIAAFYHVYNTLGYGFLERVYRNALAVTLRKQGFTVETNLPIEVRFEDVAVGVYFADLLVNRCVIVELKSAESLCPAHEAQLLNYLRATNIEVGLLLNFGPKPQIKRKSFSNARKRSIPPADPAHP